MNDTFTLEDQTSETSQGNTDENPSALTAEMQDAIPKYADTSGAERQVLENLVGAVDFGKVESAKAFGSGVLDELNAGMEKIDRTMMENGEGVYADALSEFTNELEGLKLKEAQSKAKEAVKSSGGAASKAIDFAKRHTRDLAIAGGGLLAAPFTLGATGVASVAALGNMGRKEWQRAKTSDVQVAALEARLQEGIKGIKPALEKIKSQKENIGKECERLEELRESFEKTVLGAAVHIAAGREIQTRLKTHIDELKKNPSKERELQKAQRVAVIFDQRMIMLESTYSMSASGLIDIERRKDTYIDVDMTFESILGWETALIRADAVQASTALQTFRMAKTAREFREKTNQNREDTATITKLAEDAARDSRADSPKVLEERRKQIEQQIRDQRDSLAKEASFHAESRAERQKLMEKTHELQAGFEVAAEGKLDMRTEAATSQEHTEEEAPRVRARSGGVRSRQPS